MPEYKIFPIVFSVKIGVFFALLPLSIAHAEVAQSLSLPQAIELAFAENPDLAAARWEVDVAKGYKQQAALTPNPQLSWETEDTRRNTATTTVILSQALELGGKRSSRMLAASRGEDVAQIELERRGNELRADVIHSFYTAVRAQTGLDLARQSQTLAERGLEIAEGRVRAGKSAPVEVTRAQVQLAETRLQVQRAQTLKANSYRALAGVTGSLAKSFERLEYPDLSPGESPPLAKILPAISQSVELRLAQAHIEQRDAELGSERAQRAPDLTVSIGSQYSRQDRERINVIGLSVPIPLFNRNQGNVLAASRRADQARDLRAAAELRLHIQTRTAIEQWTSATRDIESFNKIILPAAQSAVDIAIRGFELGKFGFLEVLDAQRTLIAARGQYLDALSVATDARVEVERTYGDLNQFSINP